MSISTERCRKRSLRPDPDPAAGVVIEPKLHEQRHNYLVLQLQAYASGERRNDLFARMRTIATRLTQTEINGLAAYYAAGFR
jgi:cytochrome c553